MKTGTATLRKTRSGKWNFSLYAPNGKVLAFNGQGYEKKSEAKRILREYFPNFALPEEKTVVAKLHNKLAKGRK